MVASLVLLLTGWSSARADASEIAMPAGDPRDAVEIRATDGQRWRQGPAEVWLFTEGCELVQGGVVARGRNAVLWIERESAGSNRPSRVMAYFEGDVQVDFGQVAAAGAEGTRATRQVGQRVRDRQWFGRFHTWNEVEVRVPVAGGEPATKPAFWQRALAQRKESASSDVVRAQWVEMNPPIPPPLGSTLGPDFVTSDGRPTTTYQPGAFPPGSGPPGAVASPGMGPSPYPPNTLPPGAIPPWTLPPGGLPPGAVPPVMGPPAQPGGLPPSIDRRPMPGAGIKKIESRNSGGFNAKTFDGPDGKPAGFIVDSGVRLVFDAIENLQFQGYSVKRIDVEADRVVVWGDMPKLSLNDTPAVPESTNEERPIEVYLEGNIVFREGDRVIYAERMYYNVTYRFGVVLAAELLTPVPRYAGLVRLKADALQMFNQQTMQAHGAAITTSRLGVPGYWFQADTVQLHDQQRTRLDPVTRAPMADAATGEILTDHSYLATSRDNWIFLDGIPVFYWPFLATDLNNPGYYLQRAQIKHDNVFGTQVMLDWDLFQLLGCNNQPPGWQWNLSTDYLSSRGFGGGTSGKYQGDMLLGHAGHYYGAFDAWGLNDSGIDNLGIDRRDLIPPFDWRGRVFWQHRHRFGEGYQLTAEIGLISDRNFMEEFFERDWDTKKDLTTGIEFKHLVDNMSWNLSADYRVNSSFMQADWLPRFDHYWLGASPLSNILTYNEHTHVGYARLHDAAPPTDPTDAAKFSLLQGEVNNEGLHTATRQEIDLPFELGPVKFVPYLLGEAAYFGEDINGDPLTRLYGQGGVRSSIPIWRADPGIQSELFNLNGLAHKITLESDLYYADANQNYQQLPQYDQVDDDAIEQFRRRLLFNTYGLTAASFVPTQFDPRNFALRSGLQSSVTSPVTEIADDLAVARLGARQRWQTKRGMPGNERIVDWIVLDTHASVFLDPNRDNYGQTLGLIDYDFRWHLGDRFTLLSDGYADLFQNGLQTASIGAQISRPDRGSMYVGFRAIQGTQIPGTLTPLDSQLLNIVLDYRMTEKWIVTSLTSYDFGFGGNHNQSFSLTRAGESFLIRMGANYDFSRDNFGFVFMIEPRALPNHRLGRVAGVPIPPAGTSGLD